MINCFRKIFLLILLAPFIFLFWHETASAIEVQCEYIPRDSSGKIIYFEGSDADHRPWSKKMEEAECLAKCSSESVTSLMSDCESWRGPFQNPDGCDVSHTSCGSVINPFLTVNCKFTPRNPAGSALDDAWEILTLSESDCQNLCADSMVLCSTFCGTIMDALCCDDTKTTCEATAIAATTSSTTTPHQFDSVTPKLQIPLPTLPSFSEFTDLTLQGEVPNRYLWIPWIGQYIAAIYKYAIGIVGVLAGIMIVVGGLLWLTAGGSAERVSTAKSFVESSLVGLVIALTSYLLLYAINPNLVGFESLKVKYIERSIMDPLMSHELFQEDTPGMPASGSPVVPSSGAVDIRTLVNVDVECLHTNTPVDPRWEEPLKKVAETFCRLRGSNTGWKIVGGGYRPPDDAVTYYVRRCLFRSSCTIPTGNPFTDGTIVTEDGVKVPSNASIKALKGNESALVNALLPFVKTDRPGHGSGLAFDAYCQREGVEGRQTHLKPYVPCQLLLEQAFKENGFCRLNNENWHFELTSLKASRTCNENWTIGTVQKSASGPVLDFRTCPNYWAWDNETCLER